MSRAFVKEGDGAEDAGLPELRISPHRNLVTPAGKRQMELTVERVLGELSAARQAADRSAIARAQRDLRYWAERLRTAEVVEPSGEPGKVRFGSAVTLAKPGGEPVRYRIVGEDEADPAHGRISYVSPIAKALIGAAAGDSVALPDGEAEILEIA